MSVDTSSRVGDAGVSNSRRRRPPPPPPLSNDVLVEVFSRLPMRTLHQLKSVCRSWRALISDPSLGKKLGLTTSALFFQAPGRLLPERLVCINTSTGPPPPEVGLSLGWDLYEATLLLDCCDGLALCRVYDGGRRRHCVCKPSKNEWTHLPEPIGMAALSPPPMLGLAFEPLLSPHFKVACFSGNCDGHSLRLVCEIFSSETGRWEVSSSKHIECEGGVPSRLLGELEWVCRPIYLKGEFYTLPRGWGHVVSYGVREGKISTVDLPEDTNQALSQCLGHCGGCLHYAFRDRRRLRVWMRRRRGDVGDNDGPDVNCWILKHETSIQALVERYHGVVHPPSTSYFPTIFTPLAFLPDIEAVFLQMHSYILLYHFDRGKLDLICRRSGGYVFLETLSVFPFSLLPSSNGC